MEDTNIHVCADCGEEFEHHSSLWKHRQHNINCMLYFCNATKAGDDQDSSSKHGKIDKSDMSSHISFQETQLDDCIQDTDEAFFVSYFEDEDEVEDDYEFYSSDDDFDGPFTSAMFEDMSEDESY